MIQETKDRMGKSEDSFKKEFTKYRDQLTESYLKDDSTIDFLSRQAYERMKYEIKDLKLLLSGYDDTELIFKKID